MTKVVLTFKSDPEKVQFGKNACLLLESIINKQSFQNRVLNGNFSGRSFRQDDGTMITADNRYILQQIMTGKELGTSADNIIALTVEIEKLGRKIVGRVKPPDPLIITNSTFFNYWLKKGDTLSLAAHWIHEWLHVSGFRHAGSDPDKKDVSYLIGLYAVETGREPLILFGADFYTKQGQGYLDAYDIQAENEPN